MPGRREGVVGPAKVLVTLGCSEGLQNASKVSFRGVMLGSGGLAASGPSELSKPLEGSRELLLR